MQEQVDDAKIGERLRAELILGASVEGQGVYRVVVYVNRELALVDSALARAVKIADGARVDVQRSDQYIMRVTGIDYQQVQQIAAERWCEMVDSAFRPLKRMPKPQSGVA